MEYQDWTNMTVADQQQILNQTMQAQIENDRLDPAELREFGQRQEWDYMPENLFDDIGGDYYV